MEGNVNQCRTIYEPEITAEMQKLHLKQQKMRDLSKTQATNTIHNDTNYDRVIHYANISFTRYGTRLLCKGLKYVTE